MDSMTYKFNSTGSKVVNRLSVPWFLAEWPLLLPRWSGRVTERCTQPLPTASAGVDGLMERDLLSRVTGYSGRQRLQGQGQDPRPPPSPTLSLRVGTEQRQGRAADDANRGHGHEPQQAQAAAAAAANVVSLLPSSSRVQFAPDGRLASVVVPGYPMSERRHNLRAAGAGAPRAQGTRMMPVQEQRQRASPAGPEPAPAPQRPPMAPVGRTLELAVAGPTVTTGPGPERCDACGLSARLLQGLSGDLDRAKAQLALLTCQNESLRHRLKRASASASAAATAGAECPAAASSAHLNLRCGACQVRPATVQLVPREHLCLCGHCSNSSRDGRAVACPVCGGAVGTWPGPAEAAPR